MEEFAPIIFLIIVYLCIWLPLSQGKKAKQRRAQATSAKARKVFDADQAPPAEPKESMGTEGTEKRILQPSVEVTRPTDDFYRGSMNAVTGEGEDPCHEDQMSVLDAVSLEDSQTGLATSGGSPLWTGPELVRGFVIGEVLRRRNDRR